MVSVIVPNYNHASYLRERLDSIFNQTYQDFEVILLDDASTDASVSILNEYAGDKKVSHFIVNKKNSGSPFKQWKKGLELAQGEYIWIAESDDSCELDFLESQLKTIKDNIATVSKIIIKKNGQITKREITHAAFNKNNKITLTALNFSFNCPITNVSSVLFKTINKEKLSKSTFHNYSIMGDIVFYYEFFNSDNIIFNPNTINYYRQDAGSLSILANKDKKYLFNLYNQQVKFINLIYKKEKEITREIKNKYLKRKFNKVRNRITFDQKLSLGFLTLYLKFKFQKLK